MSSLPPPPAPRRAAQWRRFPVTAALIAVNVAVFAYEQLLSVENLFKFELGWALIPLRFSHPERFIFVNGSTESGIFLLPRELTLVTSLFLHSGLPHIALNMLIFYGVGRMLEISIGSWRFAVIYAVAGLASSFASLLAFWRANELTQVIGASGAIYGVLAAYLLLLPPGGNRTRTFLWLAALEIIPALLPARLIVQLTGSDFLASIDHWGHIGGFIAGGLVMQAFILRAKQRRPPAAPPVSVPQQGEVWEPSPPSD